MIIEDFKLLLL